jgi:hypothetical protein
VSARKHLEQVERQTGRRPAELDGPPFPSEVFHIWSAFVALTTTRGQGQDRPLPITYLEMKAWSDLTNNHLGPREVEAIKQIDSAYLRIANG